MAVYSDQEDEDRSLEGASTVEAFANELVKSYGFGRNPDGSWDWSVDRIAKSFKDSPVWTTLDYLTLAAPVAKWGTALRAVSKGVGAVGKAYEAGEFAGKAASTTVGRFVEKFAGSDLTAAAELYQRSPHRGLGLTIGGRDFRPLQRFSSPAAQQLDPEYLRLASSDKYGAEWWEGRAIARSLDKERVIAQGYMKRTGEDLISTWGRKGITDQMLKNADQMLELGVKPESDLAARALGNHAGAMEAYKNTWSFRNMVHERGFDLKLFGEDTYEKNLDKNAPRVYAAWSKIRALSRQLTDSLPAGSRGGGVEHYLGKAEDPIWERILDPRATIQELAKAGQVIAREDYLQKMAQSAVSASTDELRDLAVRIVTPGNEKLATLHGIDPKKIGQIRELMVARATLEDTQRADAAATAAVAAGKAVPEGMRAAQKYRMTAEDIGKELGWKKIDDVFAKIPGYVNRLPDELKDRWIDPLAAKDLQGTYRQLSDPQWYHRLYGAMVDTFRAAKTAYNPAQGIRNFMGAAITNHFVTGGIPDMIPRLGFKEWMKGGEEFAAAAERGIIGSSFTTQIREGLRAAFRGINPDEKMLGKATALDWMGEGKLAQIIQSGASKAEQVYRANDEIWKLQSFMKQTRKYIGQGLEKEAARDRAAYDVFKFSPNNAIHSEVADQLRKAVPFASFTTEALRVYKNLMQEKPHIAFFWNHAMESLSYVAGAMGGFDAQQIDDAKKSLPEYAQGKKMVVMPFNIDGTPQFLDMSYMLPLGNLQQDASESVFMGGLIDPTVNPLLNAVAAGATGKDPFTGRDIQPEFTERQLGIPVTNQKARRVIGLAEHMATMMLPPLVPPGYAGVNLMEAARGQNNPATGEPLEQGVLTAILRNVAGFHLETANVESQVLNVRREQGAVRDQIGQAWNRWEFAKVNGNDDAMEAERERIIELRKQEGASDDKAEHYFESSAKNREPFSNLSTAQLQEILARAQKLGQLSPESEQARQILEKRLRGRGKR